MIDFLIIGGGVAGLSAAAKLSPLGKTVVLEAEEATGYHASGRSAAMYLKDYGNPAVRALNYASHFELEGTGVLKSRHMMIPSTADQLTQFKQDCIDEGMSDLSLTDAFKLCPILNPDTIVAAAINEDTYDVDTDLLLQHYIKTARKNGAEIHTNSRVDAIEKFGAEWQVRAGPQTHRAHVLLNAAGAWVDRIAMLAGIAPIGFQPYRRSVARMPAPGGRDVSDWPFMIGVGETWFAKADAGKWLVSPAEKDPMDPFDAYADDMVLAEGIARYQDHVTEPVTRVENSWAGLRTFAPDDTLVVGRDKDDPSFIWIGGQGGYGYQTAPAASALVADILAERSPAIDPHDYDPARFR